MEASNKTTFKRRDFLKLSSMTGTVLAVGYYLPSLGKSPELINAVHAEEAGIQLNNFIFIDTAGKVTLVNHRPEMGQGVYQSMPMLLAEELEVDLEQVDIVQAQGDSKKYGRQSVGGSNSVRSSWEASRKIGAAAREMLIEAATKKWSIAKSDCYAENGQVINKKNKASLHYGELVEAASTLTAPENPTLKSPKDFKILGTPLPRKDVPLKTNGTAEFGIDVKVPGMLYASVERCPVFEGKVKSFDDTETLKVKGVQQVVKSEMTVFRHTREGVAVIADNYWSALQGRKKLKVEWDFKGHDKWDNKTIHDDYRASKDEKGLSAVSRGNFSSAYGKASKTVEAEYECPFQAHATMEPMNCVVSVVGDKCEFWGPTQSPNWVRGSLAGYLKVAPENVTINVSFLGGGFGRRAFTDFPNEAAFLSKKIGKPIKVVWTREDDVTQGPFRPCSLNVLKGGLDDKGNLVALEDKMVAQITSFQFPGADKNKVQPWFMEGANHHYEVPNLAYTVVPKELPIPIMWWRSVYSSTNGFAQESFMDELAHAAGKDPLEFRLELLKDEPRFSKLLETLRDKSEWKKDKDAAYGVAIVHCFGSYCGQVAKIRKSGGKIKIEKYTSVIDCGMTVNPDIVKAQIEGSIMMGLTAAFKSEIEMKEGRAVQANFDKFKMLRISEAPNVDTYIMQNEEAPGGVGEPGLPPAAPALTNAIFELTGKRIRKLPFDIASV